MLMSIGSMTSKTETIFIAVRSGETIISKHFSTAARLNSEPSVEIRIFIFLYFFAQAFDNHGIRQLSQNLSRNRQFTPAETAADNQTLHRGNPRINQNRITFRQTERRNSAVFHSRLRQNFVERRK